MDTLQREPMALMDLVARFFDLSEKESAKFCGELRAQAQTIGASAVVVFTDLRVTPYPNDPRMMLVGPECTYTSAAAVDGHPLGDVPSRFVYPTAWAPTSDE